jgi:hypothetical protein
MPCSEALGTLPLLRIKAPYTIFKDALFRLSDIRIMARLSAAK